MSKIPIEKHRSAWKKIRNTIFKKGKDSRLLYLSPDERYVDACRQTLSKLVSEDPEDQKFQEYLRVASSEISNKFYTKNFQGKFPSYYHVYAYALEYGLRSVAAIEFSLMEYFLDYCNAIFEGEIRILDLGAGPGSSIFGVLTFLKEYGKQNNFFREKVKKIKIDCVELDPMAFCFCDEMKAHIKESFKEFNPEINVYDKSMEKFLLSGVDGEYDIIVASKSFSELSCAQVDTHNANDYRAVVADTLRLLNPEGVLIIVEAAGGQNKKLIKDTVELVLDLGSYIFSPCVGCGECLKVDCWGWKAFLYEELNVSKKIKDVERKMESFYSLLITKFKQSFPGDVLPGFETEGMGALKYMGVVDPLKGNACTSEQFKPSSEKSELRGKYLFVDEVGNELYFGIDIEEYWW